MFARINGFRLLVTGISLILLAACALSPQPTAAPTPTNAQPQPSPTLTPGRPTPALPAPTGPAAGYNVAIFFIAVGDHGQRGIAIGCDDSAVPLQLKIPASPDPIQGALERLFAFKSQTVKPSELYNALYQSNLKVDSVTLDSTGKATVNLSGEYLLGGACDDPRFKAQIEETVLNFPQVTDVAVFINGIPLDEILSEKGAAPTQGATIDTANIYLVALEDNGASGEKIGCGDSLIPAKVPVPVTSDPAIALKAALQALVTAGDKYAGGAGLYNVFKSSLLQVDGVTIENGVATIQLSGTLNLGGECDNPRVSAQLEATARQFPQVQDVAIFLNEKPLQEVLNLSGK